MKKFLLVLAALVAFSSVANARWVGAFYSFNPAVTIIVQPCDCDGIDLIMVMVEKEFRFIQYEMLDMKEIIDGGVVYRWEGKLKSNPAYTMVRDLTMGEGLPFILYTEKTFYNGKLVKTTKTKMQGAEGQYDPSTIRGNR